MRWKTRENKTKYKEHYNKTSQKLYYLAGTRYVCMCPCNHSILKHNECANLMLLLFCLETHRTNTFYDNNQKLFIFWLRSFFLSNFSHNINLESAFKSNQRLEEDKKNIHMEIPTGPSDTTRCTKNKDKDTYRTYW